MNTEVYMQDTCTTYTANKNGVKISSSLPSYPANARSNDHHLTHKWATKTNMRSRPVVDNNATTPAYHH